MTNALDGGTDMFNAIMEAKHNHDYSAVELPDGSEPQNWGQFRKAVMSDRDKSKENLGAIMSGRADKDGDGDKSAKTNNGKGPDKDKNNGNNGKAKGKDKNKNKKK